jgi:phosphatidylglycerol:prolipoprotein diacylglycerol transferase
MNLFSLFVFHWHTEPEIFMITDNFGIRWYSLMFGLAFFIGYYILMWMFKKENKNVEDADELLMYMFFAVLIGARLGHVIFYGWDYYSQNLAEIPMIWKGGLASHGAAIAIPIALYLYKRKHKDQSYLWIIDRVAIPLSLGAAFVRFGNFFNHEIVGDYTNGSWGVFFHNHIDELTGMLDTGPRVPIQLFEGFLYVFLFCILITYYISKNYKPKEGTVMAILLFVMFIGRFFLEFWKDGEIIINIAGVGLNRGNVLSIPFIILGFIIFFIANKKKSLK